MGRTGDVSISLGAALCLLITTIITTTTTTAAPNPQPHILLIVADDLGWNDVGWNNPKMKTPNLNVLAREGVILNNSYVQPVCSPSRAALLTGYYPHKLGIQLGALRSNKPTGLPRHHKLLPQLLRKEGYETHMIGKWHLGFCRWALTPTHRGFKTFYGFYTGARDYYTHRSGKEKGFDFRMNTKPIRRKGIHSNDLFTKRAMRVIRYHNTSRPMFLYMSYQLPHAPLQVPTKYLKLYSDVDNWSRRKYSGMVSMLDGSVGQIVSALMSRSMLANTLIVFMSDNGGAPYEGGSNWPLRGAKSTLWEGGTRVPAFVYGNMLRKRGYTSNEMVHITDWLPTLMAAARSRPRTAVDGVNQLNTLVYGWPSARSEFIYSINKVKGRSAIRSGPWKLLLGQPGNYNDWYPPATWDSTPADNWRWKVLGSATGGRHTNHTYLFNLHDDPLERHNLADHKPQLVKQLKRKLHRYQHKVVQVDNPRKVRKAHPKRWAGFWSPGWC